MEGHAQGREVHSPGGDSRPPHLIGRRYPSGAPLKVPLKQTKANSTCTHIHTIHVYTLTHTCVHAHMHTCSHVHTNTHRTAHTCTMLMLTCSHAHAHMYTHAHTCTHRAEHSAVTPYLLSRAGTGSAPPSRHFCCQGSAYHRFHFTISNWGPAESCSLQTPGLRQRPTVWCDCPAVGECARGPRSAA